MVTWIATLLVAVFVASVSALVLFFHDAQANTLPFEIAKVLLQLGFVAVVGALISLFTFEYQRERRRQDEGRELGRKNLEYREDLLKTTLAKAMVAYGSIKKARQLLRARAFVPVARAERVVLARFYDEYMAAIIDGKLDIENLARDIKTSAPAFGSAAAALVGQLQSMDGYLKGLVTEYEDCRSGFEGDDPVRKLSELPVLGEFTVPGGTRFHDRIVDPYHKVQEGIREGLLHPRLTTASEARTGPSPRAS